MPVILVLLASSALTTMGLGASSTATPVPTMHTKAPINDDLARALGFLKDLDKTRLFEKAYAEQVLQEIEIVRASELYEGDFKAGVDQVRMIALWAADRTKDATTQADAIFAGGTASPEILAIAFTIAADADPQKAVAYLERADKDLLTPEQRATFKDGIEEDSVSAIMQPLFRARNQADLARLSEGLLKFEWPGDVHSQRHDHQRFLALKGRLAKADVVGARALARQISAPDMALELLVAKAYDGLMEDGDRPALVAALISAEDRRDRQGARSETRRPEAGSQARPISTVARS